MVPPSARETPPYSFCFSPPLSCLPFAQAKTTRLLKDKAKTVPPLPRPVRIANCVRVKQDIEVKARSHCVNPARQPSSSPCSQLTHRKTKPQTFFGEFFPFGFSVYTASQGNKEKRESKINGKRSCRVHLCWRYRLVSSSCSCFLAVWRGTYGAMASSSISCQSSLWSPWCSPQWTGPSLRNLSLDFPVEPSLLMLELRRCLGSITTELATEGGVEAMAASGVGPCVRGRGLVRWVTDCWRDRGGRG